MSEEAKRAFRLHQEEAARAKRLMEGRRSLSGRSAVMMAWADEKLIENTDKGNHWKELPYEELFLMLSEEVNELHKDVIWLEYHASEGARAERRRNIQREIGDVMNCLRFIADKAEVM